jgi:hypothetical protein
MRIAEHVLVIVQSAEFGGWQICWTLYGSCFDIGATPTIHQLQITSDFILTWKWICSLFGWLVADCWLQPRLLCMNIIALLLVTRMILRKAVALLSLQWGLVFFLSFFLGHFCLKQIFAARQQCTDQHLLWDGPCHARQQQCIAGVLEVLSADGWCLSAVGDKLHAHGVLERREASHDFGGWDCTEWDRPATILFF